jgi:hypothetical protein
MKDSIKKIFKFHVYPFIKLLLMVVSYPFWMFFIPYKKYRFLEFSRFGWNALPIIQIDKIIPDEIDDNTVVSIKAILPNEHNCTVIELFVLGLATKIIRASNAYEIGTYDGRSSLAIASNIEEKGNLYTLNLPEGYFDNNPDKQQIVDVQLSRKVRSGYRFLCQSEKTRIVQCWGNSLEFVAEKNAPYDLIFIDGAHDYETVKYDSLEALRLINKNNGIILWHDATNFGVGKWLPELMREGNHVYRIAGTDIAIMRFIAGNNIKYSGAK